MRHPASAYVQGINDLAAPIVLVFLVAAVEKNQQRKQEELKKDIEEEEVKQLDMPTLQNQKSNDQGGDAKYKGLSLEDIMDLPLDEFLAVEADAFWCLSKLIDDIQDNYTDM